MDTKFNIAGAILQQDRYWRYKRLSPIPKGVRLSRRLRKAHKRNIAYLLDLERQFHISDDVSEERMKKRVLDYQADYYRDWA